MNIILNLLLKVAHRQTSDDVSIFTTEIVKKYTPQRVDHSYLALNRAFGLDGRPAAIFA